jgi:hypothetical protein
MEDRKNVYYPKRAFDKATETFFTNKMLKAGEEVASGIVSFLFVCLCFVDF